MAKNDNPSKDPADRAGAAPGTAGATGASAASGAATSGDPLVAAVHAVASEVGKGTGQLADAIRVIPDRIRPPGGASPVVLERPGAAPTADECLWAGIKTATNAIAFDAYTVFLDEVLCATIGTPSPTGRGYSAGGNTPAGILRSLQDDVINSGVIGTGAYQIVRAATELFLMSGVRTLEQVVDGCAGVPADADRGSYLEVLRRAAGLRGLPYMNVIIDRLEGVDFATNLGLGSVCYGILPQRATSPCLLELIWSYWHEEGMLVQSINAVALRFQNIRRDAARDPLAHLELDPLRPLNNLLWGYLQDEHSRLSVVRRAYEYDHHYGLRLVGKAVPAELRAADTRARFLAAFHDLLFRAVVFYKEDDNRTIAADAFPVLNALRELHYILAEGAHNQFGDLPTQARGEMLIQQWLLARPEMREFLRGRVSVPYPERWMDVVDVMKSLQGWGGASVIHYNELARFGEQILLSVRYGNWSKVESAVNAANWARAWRNEIQRYVHAYRAVTGVDLTLGSTLGAPAAVGGAIPARAVGVPGTPRVAPASARAVSPPATARIAPPAPAAPALAPGLPAATPARIPSRTPPR